MRERDTLADRVKLLEASNASLDEERVELLEGLEDIRIQRERLDKDVARLTKRSKELRTNLEAREAELAKQNEEVARLRGTYDNLVQDLEEEVAAGQIQIEQLREGLRLNVSDEILFPSGSAELNAQGREVLERVSARVQSIDHTVVVEGHTDSIPIRGALAKRYPTNWELAGARAASVVRLFETNGVDPSRLTAVSYGPNKPVAPNDTAEERALNRRIEIRLKPLDKSAALEAAANVAPAGESSEAAAAEPAAPAPEEAPEASD